jgi:hypothetical protein
VRRIDFAGREWAAHAQDHWLEFAGNPNFPDYLRVTFVAYGRHAANGHARLERGELARYLIRKGGALPDRKVIKDAVDHAVQLGHLASGSRLLCLVVNSDHIQGGVGDPNARCPRDHTRRQTNDRNDSGRFASNDRNDARRSNPNDRNDSGRSTLRPSLSSTPVRQDRNTTYPPERNAS